MDAPGDNNHNSGVSGEQARSVRGSLGSAMNRIFNKNRESPVPAEVYAELKSEMTLIKWMPGTSVALNIAVLVRVFTH